MRYVNQGFALRILLGSFFLLLLTVSCSRNYAPPPPPESQLEEEAMQHVIRPCFSEFAEMNDIEANENVVDFLISEATEQVDAMVEGVLMAVRGEAQFLFRLVTYDLAKNTCVSVLASILGK